MALKFGIQIRSTRKRQPPERLIKQYKKEVRDTLRSIAMKGKINIKHEIKKRDLINKRKLRKPKRMIDSVTFKLTKQGVKFIVADPAPYLERGVKSHKMKYLMKATRPIPIELASGAVIFRWASPKSMRKKGSWRHPGFDRGKGFMKKAVNKTREEGISQINEIARKIVKDI